MKRRLLQLVVTVGEAVIMAVCLMLVDWWLYILSGKTLTKRLMNFIDNTKLKDFTL